MKRLLTTSEDSTHLSLKLEKDLLRGNPSDPAPLRLWLQSLSSSQRSQISKKLSSVKEVASTVDEKVMEPTRHQLRLVALNNSIPFFGFGIMDNAILIIAGDAIDTSLGGLLGISTMCAAAIGNIVSDVAGIGLGTLIEDFATKLNLPTPNLSSTQMQLRSVRFANQFGCAVGIVLGCIVGMFPLLFIDSNRIQVRKREAHLDAIFRDVVSEAGSLIGAQRVSLYVKVDGTERNPTPTVSGKFLYGKYGGDSKSKETLEFVPLGRGIISRAALTGEAWRIDDVKSEPDYDVKITPNAQNAVCVPVLDGQGRTLGVLQAINKVGPGREDLEEDEEDEPPTWMTKGPYKRRRFTEQDVQILKALASHIGVSLQQLYENDGEEEEMRLRDTIRIMKEYGLAGLVKRKVSGGNEDGAPGAQLRHNLFPEED